MESNAATKKHPAWKEAVEKIICRFDEEGYGCLISDDEFFQYLSIDIPKGQMTFEDFRKYSIEQLQAYKAIDVLLCDHNIKLERSREDKGFVIVEPRIQITDVHDKLMAKMRKDLNKLMKNLVCLDGRLLTSEEEKERQSKIYRTAFIKNATNKRKLELPHKDESGNVRVISFKK